MLRLNLAGRHCLALVVCLQISAGAMGVEGNPALQDSVTHAMAGRRGTAVVLDVHSGQMLAAYHLEIAARRLAAPGSAVKPFTLMALLASGKINDRTAIMCKRSLSISGHKLDCSHPDVNQPLDPASALAYSCNSYFAAVALRLTPSQLQQSLVQRGFTSVTGLARDEAEGKVAVAHSPEQLQLQAIGEWGVEVTPLEMGRAYRELALMHTNHDAKLEPLFSGLEQSTAYGMGHAAQPAGAIRVAGKTGTAPSEEGAWTHAWFAGYAPVGDPQIVLVVFLEKGHGGSDAAQVASAIFAGYGMQKSEARFQGAAK